MFWELLWRNDAHWGYYCIRMMNMFLLDCYTAIKNKDIYTMEKSLNVCQIKLKGIQMLCSKVIYHLFIFLGIRNVFSLGQNNFSFAEIRIKIPVRSRQQWRRSTKDYSEYK